MSVKSGKTTAAKATDSPLEVFIAHAWGKNELSHAFAMHVFKLMKDAGVKVHIDEKSFYYGDIWTRKAEQLIKKPTCISLLFISQEFMDSRNCMHELEKILRNSASTGKPVIPVFLGHVENLADYIPRDLIGPRLMKLFVQFVNASGRNMSSTWRRTLQREIGKLVEALKVQFNRYMESLHVFRIINTREPFYANILKQAENLYSTYPEDLCDPFDRVLEWVYETTLNKEFFPVEILQLAMYRGRVVGLIYSTLYRGELGLPPSCHINVMVVDRRFTRIMMRNDGEDRAEVVAERLLLATMDTAREIKRQCRTFVLDLPDDDDAYTTEDRELSWFAWETISPGNGELAVMKCRDFVFMQPDPDWRGDRGRQPEANPTHLLLLRHPRAVKRISNHGFKTLLFVLYWVFYAETYDNPYCLKEWVEHIGECYTKTVKSIGKRPVVLEQVLPLKE